MDRNDFVIEQVKTVTPDTADAIRKLAVQIGDNSKTLTDSDLQEILDSSQSFLFVARYEKTKQIVGMIMAMVYRIPYTKKAYLDDLIVDSEFRKLGIATKLLEEAIICAKEHHASYIDFSSRQRRTEGNALYEKMGFNRRETNIYRLLIDYEEV